jgi:hypothetical protein
MSARLEAAILELAEAIRAEVCAEVVPVSAAPDRLYGIAETCEILGIRRSRLYLGARCGPTEEPA